jgi:hypothetical protein
VGQRSADDSADHSPDPRAEYSTEERCTQAVYVGSFCGRCHSDADRGGRSELDGSGSRTSRPAPHLDFERDHVVPVE